VTAARLLAFDGSLRRDSLLTVRSILGNIGMHVLPTQVIVPQVHLAFDEQGRLKDPKQQAALESLGAAAAALAEKLRA
jgi:NAD(P)H-dependent FMN reductase